MKNKKIKIQWPNGNISFVKNGADWLRTAEEAGIKIPTGCLGGSCGACEIEVNGKIIRACIKNISDENSTELKVEFFSDPFW